MLKSVFYHNVVLPCIKCVIQREETDINIVIYILSVIVTHGQIKHRIKKTVGSVKKKKKKKGKINVPQQMIFI